MFLTTNKTILISISLLIVLSSCGKSKDLKTAPPASQPEQTKTDTPPAEPAAPVPAAPPANQIPNNNLVPQDQTSIDGNGNEILPPLPVGPAAQPAAPQTNVINPPLVPAKKETQKAYEIDFTNQVAVKTGGQSGELFYTSAGEDNLMEEFKSFNLKQNPEQQKMNANLAKAVVVAKLSRRTGAGEIFIDMSFDEFGKINKYRLLATPNGESMKLSVSKTGTTGLMPFEGGFLKCIDKDGGCENAYAKMKFAGGYTRVIFRNSYADMHFLFQENVIGNPGYDLWMNYIMGSASGLHSSTMFDSLQVSSFEVVNGRAGMGALLTTTDNDMMALSIPLVVSSEGAIVNASVAKLKDLASNYDLASMTKIYSQNLSQQVNSVKLIRNNGLGQLKLQLSLSSQAGPASLWMVISRVQKDIMSLSEINTFESKLK